GRNPPLANLGQYLSQFCGSFPFDKNSAFLVVYRAQSARCPNYFLLEMRCRETCWNQTVSR
ncbi:hypothetical protein D030_3934B, partial [Vibrio parahaemolyticus AQ3810]